MIYYILCLFLSFQILKSDSPLSERYHTYSEIDSILHELNQEFGDTLNVNSPYPNSGPIFKLIELGVSNQDSLPFWAVKLSFNAHIDEDEPRVLILGQCHAEEILGVEVSMELIERFLRPEEHPADFQSLAGILYSSEIWIVPTHNPEGLSVVHGWIDEQENWVQDVSYRKNKTDANQNGIFDYDPIGYGNDLDGVDLNRNYPLNWMFGDQYLETDEGCSSNPSYVSNYDYYRGEAPFSENEISIISKLMLDYDFILSIAYHSSRSGCVAERVIYPWNWPGAKLAPDYQVIQPLGQEIAELTPKEVGNGTYHFAASGSMRGNAHDWSYSQAGSIQYLIEVGTSNMQPDDVDLIENTIERNLPGAFHLMKRAAGINYPTGPDKYQIKGIVSDASNGMPIEGVEVEIAQMSGGVLAPRLTNKFGRYHRLLYYDSFDLKFSKHGYYDSYYDNFVPSAEVVGQYDVQLDPKPEFNIDMMIDVPDYHSDAIVLNVKTDNYNEDFSVFSGQNNLNLPEGLYTFTIISDDIFPIVQEVNLSSDLELEFYLDWYDILLDDDFIDIYSWENMCGEWNVQNGKLLSQYDLLYPNYTPVCPIRINSSDIALDEPVNAVLKLDMMYELEWDKDTLFFDLFNSSDSLRIASFYDQDWGVNQSYYYGVEIPQSDDNKLSLGIVSDITIGYRGLSLDALSLVYDPPYDCLKGDLNHDGYSQVTDIVILLDIILNEISPSGFQLCSSDKREDQNIDILDVISILNQILGE